MVTDISCFGTGEKLVGIDICPIAYYPQNEKFELARTIPVRVSYTLPKPKLAVVRTVKADESPVGLPFYEYCVITSRELADAFTRLVGWESQKGLDAGVVCVEDILSEPAIKGDTISHLYDDAGKVRQYLQYAYKYGKTKYVLFGGNDQILPIRYGFSEEIYTYISFRERMVPSDFYFSELNSDWDKNHNNVLGEEDITDYGPELEVGRLLCTKTEDVVNYTDKLIRYEMNPGNGDYTYLCRGLFTEANQMQKERQANMLAASMKEILLQTHIVSCSTAEEAESVTGTDMIQTMRKHYGYVSWLNHGEPTAIIADAVGNRKTNYGIAAVNGDTSAVRKESCNGLDSLLNREYPMIAYSIACTITPFDDANPEYIGHANIGQSFTLGKGYGGRL